MPYGEIPVAESSSYIEDYIEKVAGLSVELAGQMKRALEFALNKARSDGYDQGFRDGSQTLAGSLDDSDEEVPF